MQKFRIIAGTLLIALCSAASADEMEAGEVAIPAIEEEQPEAVTPTPAEPQPYTVYDGRSAIDAWDDTRGIRYGTHRLFPFTRGMKDAGITGWARWPMGILTLPLDLVFLPAGIVAGLWGG